MKKNKNNTKQNTDYLKPEFAGTDAQQVKQQIKKDVRNGQGAMTSREAGEMQD
ncbi:hypothetical protein GH741_02970 [Aquibacillus halophilus]|uniref:Uncharacterized protein n=1 Tax=Aquibacillus halophilus TaxID=930132 RepID=A0A6A8D7A5_9BACI|nr:hypothetical protein [Aquibacillus halophilus]MRH41633.1 hypothetical protein [Aquibacillus halophilus]